VGAVLYERGTLVGALSISKHSPIVVASLSVSLSLLLTTLLFFCRGRWKSYPSEKCLRVRLTRGTVTGTMRRAAYPSGYARCGAAAGCSTIRYQSPLFLSSTLPPPFLVVRKKWLLRTARIAFRSHDAEFCSFAMAAEAWFEWNTISQLCQISASLL